MQLHVVFDLMVKFTIWCVRIEFIEFTCAIVFLNTGFLIVLFVQIFSFLVNFLAVYSSKYQIRHMLPDIHIRVRLHTINPIAHWKIENTLFETFLKTSMAYFSKSSVYKQQSIFDGKAIIISTVPVIDELVCRCDSILKTTNQYTYIFRWDLYFLKIDN